MTDQHLADSLSAELYTANRTGSAIPLFSARHPDMTVGEAYDVSVRVLQRRMQAGEKLIGKKIGLTAKAVQEMLGIDEPDYGFLTDSMQSAHGSTLSLRDRHLAGAMVEAEIAFVMKRALPTEGVTPDMVLEATDHVTGCFELVATRFGTPKIQLVDTIADNASCALFVLGDGKADPRELNLADVTCTVRRNGEEISTGKGAAVMGSPLNSVAWLANTLGGLGSRIEAGDIVLPGSLVPLAPVAAGDRFEAEFTGIGRIACAFE